MLGFEALDLNAIARKLSVSGASSLRVLQAQSKTPILTARRTQTQGVAPEVLEVEEVKAAAEAEAEEVVAGVAKRQGQLFSRTERRHPQVGGLWFAPPGMHPERPHRRRPAK
jgi:hypothetical protein